MFSIGSQGISKPPPSIFNTFSGFKASSHRHQQIGNKKLGHLVTITHETAIVVLCRLETREINWE